MATEENNGVSEISLSSRATAAIKTGIETEFQDTASGEVGSGEVGSGEVRRERRCLGAGCTYKRYSKRRRSLKLPCQRREQNCGGQSYHCTLCP